MAIAVSASRASAPPDPAAAPGWPRAGGTVPRATALVADVSGFTALAEQLERDLGPAGADILAERLSRTFARAVAVIGAQGGLVADLVGDAIQAVWPDPSPGAAAAAQLLAAPPPTGLLPLRVGLGEGPLEAVQLGEVGDLIHGEALAAALRFAPLPPAPPPAPPIAATAVAEGDGIRWSAQLRSVVLLFLGLAPAGTAPPADLADQVAAAARIAAAHGGMLENVAAEAKGIFAVLAWGLPPSSPEGAAERALAAALLRALPAARCGLAAGKVFTAELSRLGPGRHTLCGPAANRAARLMEHAAAGEALADGALARAGGADDTATRRLALKGMGEVEAVRLTGAAATARPSPAAESQATPVGRAAEIARLAAFVRGEAVASRVMVLTGPPGIGKSALLAVAAALCRDSGGMALAATPPGFVPAGPFAAWAAPARALLHWHAAGAGLTAEGALAAIAATAGVPPTLAGFADPLFATALAAPPADLPAARRALEQRRVPATLLLALAGPAPVLLLDDADRADEASLALAAELLRQAPEARLLAALRARPAAGPLIPLLETAETLPLASLPPAALAELAARHVPVRPDHPLVAWLARQSEGNPLLANELLAALPAEALRDAARSPGAWREAQAALGLATLPDGIEATIMARVARLPFAAQAALKAAAVLGGSVTAARLAALGVPGGQAGAAEGLAALRDAGILIAGPEGAAFAQDLVRATVLDSLPGAMRRDLHRAAAMSLAADPAGRDAELARHWRAAGHPTLALRHARRAGLARRAAGAHGEAASLFRLCLDLDREGALRGPAAPLRRAAIQADLTDVLASLGEQDGAFAAGLAALATLGAPLRLAGQNWPLYLARQLALLVATIAAGPRRRMSRAARTAARLETRVSYKLSDTAYFVHGIPAFLALAVHAAVVAERAGELALAARAYGTVAYVAGVLRCGPIARYLVARALPATHVSGDAVGAQFLAGSRFWIAVTLGRWPEAARVAHDIEPYRARATEDFGEGVHLSLLASLAFHTGRVAESARLMGQVAARARANGDDRQLAWFHMHAARIALQRAVGPSAPAAAQLALAEATEARELARRIGDRPSRIYSDALRGRALRLLGEETALGQLVPALLADAAGTGAWSDFSWDGPEILAELCLHQHARAGGAETARAAARALAGARRYARIYPLGRPGALVRGADAAALAGRPRRAAALLRRAVALTRRMHCPLFERQALLATAAATFLPEPEREAARAAAAAIAAHAFEGCPDA